MTRGFPSMPPMTLLFEDCAGKERSASPPRGFGVADDRDQGMRLDWQDVTISIAGEP